MENNNKKKKNKNTVLPADSATFINQTKFRILERKLKRQGEVDPSLLFDLERDANKKEVCEWFNGEMLTAYACGKLEGLWVVKQAISQEMQKSLIASALESWAKPPNISNLDSHFYLEPQGVWNQFKSNGNQMVKRRIFYQERENETDAGIKSMDTKKASPPLIDESSNEMATNDLLAKEKNCEQKAERVYSVYDKNLGIMVDSPVDTMLKDDDVIVSQVLNRLRWVTIGFQYNWSKKLYHHDRVAPFPTDLAAISRRIIEFSTKLTGFEVSRWSPEAGIVNFYQPGDTLIGHQDKSEDTMDAPLLSISLGLGAIFVVGTDDRTEEPIALHLESGDVIVMSGASRRAFHGIPRILADSLPSHLIDDSLIARHLSHTRININIRQVYGK